MTCRIRTFLGLDSGAARGYRAAPFLADRGPPQAVASGEWACFPDGEEGGGGSSRISSGSPAGSIACNWNYRRTMGEIPASPVRLLPLHQPQRSRRRGNDSGRTAERERERERETERRCMPIRSRGTAGGTSRRRGFTLLLLFGSLFGRGGNQRHNESRITSDQRPRARG